MQHQTKGCVITYEVQEYPYMQHTKHIRSTQHCTQRPHTNRDDFRVRSVLYCVYIFLDGRRFFCASDDTATPSNTCQEQFRRSQNTQKGERKNKKYTPRTHTADLVSARTQEQPADARFRVSTSIQPSPFPRARIGWNESNNKDVLRGGEKSAPAKISRVLRTAHQRTLRRPFNRSSAVCFPKPASEFRRAFSPTQPHEECAHPSFPSS